jgi:nucleotide-binding universal stress UspA family protein
MAIEIKRILLPTDFSSYSATATKYACELVTKFDAELHVHHTLEVHLSATPGFGMGLDLPQYLQESRTAAEKALAGVLDPQWAVGRKVVRAVAEGSPQVEIVRYARTQEIDVIVLATHGRTGLGSRPHRQRCRERGPHCPLPRPDRAPGRTSVRDAVMCVGPDASCGRNEPRHGQDEPPRCR